MTQVEHADTRSIAVLGTGIMGAGIARNLQKNGFQTRAWNRTFEKASALADNGVQVHELAANAVQGAVRTMARSPNCRGRSSSRPSACRASCSR